MESNLDILYSLTEDLDYEIINDLCLENNWADINNQYIAPWLRKRVFHKVTIRRYSVLFHSVNNSHACYRSTSSSGKGCWSSAPKDKFKLNLNYE
jgi:hypothetical protein